MFALVHELVEQLQSRIAGCHLSPPKIMVLLRTQIFWKFLTRNFDLMIFLSEFSVEWFQQFPVFLETRQNPPLPFQGQIAHSKPIFTCPSHFDLALTTPPLNVVGVEGNKEVRTSCYPFPALPLPISLFPDPWLCPSCSLPL